MALETVEDPSGYVRRPVSTESETMGHNVITIAIIRDRASKLPCHRGEISGRSRRWSFHRGP